MGLGDTLTIKLSSPATVAKAKVAIQCETGQSPRCLALFGITEAHDAVGMKDWDRLDEVLAGRQLLATVVPDTFGKSLQLLQASVEGNVSVVDSIDKTAIPNGYRNIALRHAVKAGHCEVARVLLNAGIDANVSEPPLVGMESNFLHPLITISGEYESCKYTAFGLDGKSQHLIASGSGQKVNILKEALARQTEIAQSRFRLYRVCTSRSGAECSLKLLADNERTFRKDLDSNELLVVILPDDGSDETAFADASARFEMMKALRATETAANARGRDVVQMCVTDKRKLDAQAANSTLLMHAMTYRYQPTAHDVHGTKKNEEMVQLLLEGGADPNAGKWISFQSKSGRFYFPALLQAIHLNNPDIVRLLLAAGADANTPDQDGLSALLLTVSMPCAGTWKPEEKFRGLIVHDLLAAGADVEFVANSGANALICATTAGNKEHVVHLLRAGAYTEAVDDEGSTALAIALSTEVEADTTGERQQVVQMLTAAGAHLSASILHKAQRLAKTSKRKTALAIQARRQAEREAAHQAALENQLAAANQRILVLMQALQVAPGLN